MNLDKKTTNENVYSKELSGGVKNEPKKKKKKRLNEGTSFGVYPEYNQTGSCRPCLYPVFRIIPRSCNVKYM